MSRKPKSKIKSSKPHNLRAKKKPGSSPKPKAKDPINGMLVDIPKELRVSNAPDTSMKKFMMAVAEEKSAPRMDREEKRRYAAIATYAWRARGRVVDPDSEDDEPREETGALGKDIMRLYKALPDIGLQVTDNFRKAYDTGVVDATPIDFKPTPGISREEIIETVRPTIRFKGELIQGGEIIVGTPIVETNNNEGDNNATDNN